MVIGDQSAIDDDIVYNETAGTFTETLDLYSAFSNAYNIGYYTNVGAAGLKTVGYTYPNATTSSIAAVELLAGASPVLTAELWEGGVFKQTLGTYPVSGPGIVSVPWDASVLASLAGTNAELRITSDIDLDIDAVEWNYITTGVSGGAPPPTQVESWNSILF
jgi:hypothetical protein